MKQRSFKKQFWYIWHHDIKHVFSRRYGLFDWGVGRIKHQIKN